MNDELLCTECDAILETRSEIENDTCQSCMNEADEDEKAYQETVNFEYMQ